MSSSSSSSGYDTDSSSSSSSSSSSGSEASSRSRNRTEYKEKEQTEIDQNQTNDKGKDENNVSLSKLLSSTDNKVQISKIIEAEKLKRGGVYLPPFKLKRLIEEENKRGGAPESKIDKDVSVEYQKMTWTILRKNINGLVNKVNVNNMKEILPELFEQNLVRGRGLLARSIMKAQMASPTFTHIYAALVAVINTKLPENGRLLLSRVIIQFRRAFKRNDKLAATALARFIAHLVNQRVAHEILALEVIQLLLSNPSNASVEVAIEFTKEVGMLLDQIIPKGLHAVFETFREILQTGRNIDKRVQYRIDDLFAVRREKFVDYPTVIAELDLVELEDQITHQIGLDDVLDKEEILDVFRLDPKYTENNKLWSQIRKEILGVESETESSNSSDESSSENSSEGEDETKENEIRQFEQSGIQLKKDAIKDMTEAELVQLRRVIYLTIMSSLDFEECVHKLLKINIPDGLEHELINMLVECCSQERTFVRFYGFLAQRLCVLDPKYQAAFCKSFNEQYATIHRLETNQLRNVAKLFAHLIQADVLPWTVMSCIHLNEDETTSSSRIFIKLLCQDLAESLGIEKLRKRFFEDDSLKEPLEKMFPMDDPRNTRFAINFFTLIGLGKLTDEMRAHLQNAPKVMPLKPSTEQSGDESDSSSSSSSSSSSTGSSDSSGASPRSRNDRRTKRDVSISSSNTESEPQTKKREDKTEKEKNRDDSYRNGYRERSLGGVRSRQKVKRSEQERDPIREKLGARSFKDRHEERNRSRSAIRKNQSIGRENSEKHREHQRSRSSSMESRPYRRRNRTERGYSSGRSSSRSRSSGRERRLSQRKRRRRMRSRSRSRS